jgi:two-component system, cell cycle sensor histidine kinase and response regulator CckA
MVLDLNDTVDGMLRMLKRLIGEDIELIWRPDTDIWPVKMDPAQLDQILANLCMNARDAIPNAGKVTIETENIMLDHAYCADHLGFKPGQYVMLAVSDNGCGKDKEIADKIFEPFLPPRRQEKEVALGFPLSMASSNKMGDLSMCIANRAAGPVSRFLSACTKGVLPKKSV